MAHDSFGRPSEMPTRAASLPGGGVPYGGRQLFAELGNLFCVRHCDRASFSKRNPAPGWLEQGVPERLLEQAHLLADRLDRHVRAERRPAPCRLPWRRPRSSRGDGS
jgi:hypothetical protein